MKQLTTEIIIISIYRKGVKKMQKVLVAGATGYLALTGTSLLDYVDAIPPKFLFLMVNLTIRLQYRLITMKFRFKQPISHWTRLGKAYASPSLVSFSVMPLTPNQYKKYCLLKLFSIYTIKPCLSQIKFTISKKHSFELSINLRY